VEEAATTVVVIREVMEAVAVELVITERQQELE
jgi:hypothetical protein